MGGELYGRRFASEEEQMGLKEHLEEGAGER